MQGPMAVQFMAMRDTRAVATRRVLMRRLYAWVRRDSVAGQR